MYAFSPGAGPGNPHQADILRVFGCEASVEDFRRTLAEVKAKHDPDITDEELTYIRDEAGTSCSLVRKRLSAPRLTRPYILRSPIGLGKQRKRAASS